MAYIPFSLKMPVSNLTKECFHEVASCLGSCCYHAPCYKLVVMFEGELCADVFSFVFGKWDSPGHPALNCLLARWETKSESDPTVLSLRWVHVNGLGVLAVAQVGILTARGTSCRCQLSNLACMACIDCHMAFTTR